MRPSPSALLFPAACFASAFLIFLVQPMVGKRLLPWFGGAPAVWLLCLAFYQCALFAGYAYAHGLMRAVPPRLQLVVHGALCGAALLALPVVPGEAARPGGAAAPTGAVLSILLANVGIPFMALAATAPLVQAWFARVHPGSSPYPLYAVSNLGSLLALFGYPFLLEPRLPLSLGSRLWSLAFAATAAAVLACAALAGRARASGTPAVTDRAPLRPRQLALWALLSGNAVLLLMGVTNELCLDVASVPFLWILPLAVYLVTFILCFGSERLYRRRVLVTFTAVVLLLRLAVQWGAAGEGGIAAVAASIQVEVVLLCLLLFGVCMLLHGELYRLRPAASSLTVFYLCVSGGGALGGLAAAVLAPRLFDDYHELGLGLVAAGLLVVWASWGDPSGWLRAGAPRWRRVVAVLLVALAGADYANQLLSRPAGVLHQERSFFGVLRVVQPEGARVAHRQLLHGATRHGVQFLARPGRPTSYYGTLSGVGLALGERDGAAPWTIGVVGLGIGTLAAYGRQGDRFVFLEIDPAVIRIARDERFFSYLARSRARVELVEGDGRISLERAGLPAFGVLVIDAFNSDAIPVHLLTREALEVYLGSLEAGGLLAFHVSNRHFDLVPILARLAGNAGLEGLVVENETLLERLTAASTWVLLSRSPERIRSLREGVERRRIALGLPPSALRVQAVSRDQAASAPLWTDDYSDLLAALRPLRIRIR